MLMRFHDVLREAERRKGAAAAFTCYDLEATAAVLEVAACRGRPVILLVAASSVRGAAGEAFLAALLGYAGQAKARCCVQVDHVNDLRLIGRVLELGAGAVMADGSLLSLEENIALVRSAVDFAEETGAAVEAELGRIEGHEDVALVASEGQLTDPDKARCFVAASGAACLAVSVGNVHGHYRKAPRLDWRRLEEIRLQVKVPLALHGASGLPDRVIRKALQLGIRKVNINTEVREAYLRATAEMLDTVQATAAVAELHRAQTEEIAKTVAGKLALLDSKEAATTRPSGEGSEPRHVIQPGTASWRA